MIIKPKNSSCDKVGGYLLNDVKFNEDIFIEKKGYSVNSVLTKDSQIFNTTNKVSSVPFKINIELLNFLMDTNLKLLLDPNIEAPYANIEKRYKFQDNLYKSYNSKVILQETILDIAEFYPNFRGFYFPLR